MNLKTITFDSDKWQLVPKEITPAITTAIQNEDEGYIDSANASSIYAAAIDAAPQPPELPPKVALVDSDDMRAEFEKWFNTQDYSADVRTWAWNGFRAARKLSAPEVVSKTTDTVVPDETAKCAVCGNKLSLSCCDKGAK